MRCVPPATCRRRRASSGAVAKAWRAGCSLLRITPRREDGPEWRRRRRRRRPGRSASGTRCASFELQAVAFPGSRGGRPFVIGCVEHPHQGSRVHWKSAYRRAGMNQDCIADGGGAVGVTSTPARSSMSPEAGSVVEVIPGAPSPAYSTIAATRGRVWGQASGGITGVNPPRTWIPTTQTPQRDMFSGSSILTLLCIF